MKVKSESEVTQSCPTLSDTMDCNLPDSSVHEIFQARVLEWVAIALSDVSMVVSQIVPHSPSPAEFTSPSSTSVYLLLPFKYSAVPFYKIPCVCIHILYLFFSL